MSTVSRRTGRGTPAFFVIVVVAALAVRLVHLLVFAGATVFFDPAPWNTPGNPLDPGEYDRWAMQITHDDPWWTDHGQGVYFQSPVYPYFVAAVYFVLGGRNVLAVTMVQAVLGALACGLAGLAARRWISVRAGWVAGGLAALYGPAIFYESFLLKETLATFLVTAAMLLSLRVFGGKRTTTGNGIGNGAAAILLTGFLWGAAMATWPLLAPVVAAVFAWACGRAALAARSSSSRRGGFPAGRHASLVAGWLLCGLFLAILPCTVRNVVGEERFVLISDAGPRNWQVGNSVNSSGTYVDFPGEPLPMVSPRFWKLFVRKVGLFLRGGEIPQVTDYDLLREASPVLSLPVPGFGLVAPLALIGVWLTRRRWGDLFPVHALALIYPLSVALFFVVGRFRLPVMPAFLVLAAATVDHLLAMGSAAAGRRRRTLLWTTTALAALLVVINWSWPLPRGVYPIHHAMASYYLEMGKVSIANGRAENALDAYNRILRLPSRSYRALAHAGRAEVSLRLLGRRSEALAELRRSLEIDPGHREAARVRETIRRLEAETATSPPPARP